MDFLNRNPQPSNARASGAPAVPQGDGSQRARRVPVAPGWLRGLFVALLLSGTILAIAAVSLLIFSSGRENRYVDKGLYQAVFLTNGQVYFGKVKGISNKFIDLQDIYYLNSAQNQSDKDKNAQNAMSLVKLGCELHGPNDQMIVNRDQVTFWENLGDNGKVAKAIAQWKQQNPKGQTCSETTNSTTQSQGGTTTPATTKP